ncbi:DUF3152 domain-containing protein [Streptomyces sp. NPDC014889]|uniref:DUF3152 domain-containing protein n=1 Tax=Streptomyces sp. NPDC014889 TaxID=3364928 RepID=UPI0037021D30
MGGPEGWDGREYGSGAEPWRGPSGRPGPGPASGQVPGQRAGAPGATGPAYRGPRPHDGTPAHGTPRLSDGTPAHGTPRFNDGTPPHGVPHYADGTPARGIPRAAGGVPGPGGPPLSDGAPAQGGPRPSGGARRSADGTPAHGTPRPADGTPARGVPRVADGTPARGIPRVRGGHPEQREAGGGWGQLGVDAMDGSGAQGPTAAGLDGSTAPAASARARAPIPRQRRASPAGPRQDYLDAFDEDDDVFAPRADARTANQAAAPPSGPAGPDTAAGGGDGAARPDGESARGTATKGKTFTGIAAAAVTTVLAVVVAGQVADDRTDAGVLSQSATDRAAPNAADIAGADSGTDGKVAPPNVSALTYGQKMTTKYPLSPTLEGSGRFDAVPGFAKAHGTGRKYTYRVDVEQGLGLDGELFAAAVQKTLNDDRSWAHNGGRTFERVSSGKPDFVITLASPGTTATWCAESGLDTTVDNVSCDSAATERVMINAYRWAQGSKTYGDEMYAYRQMLINHEVGHRLGYGHVTCDKDGALAPVMQQQTKFLDHDGIHCLPNAWPYPGS